MSFDEPATVEPYVRTAAVCKHLGGIDRHTLLRYVREQGMPAHLARNGRYLYKLSEVDAWMFEFACTSTRADQRPSTEGVA